MGNNSGMLEAARKYEPGDLLTIDEVVAWLQIPKGTIYNFVSFGRIPHIKISGRHLRFSRVELLAWLRDKSNDQ